MVVVREGGAMRCIGLDVHRDFCEVAIAEGGRVRLAGRVATEPDALAAFARGLEPTDEVALEATGNALAIARILEPHVGRVVLAHPPAVRAATSSRAKTDRIDARRLAQLLAGGFWPRCGPPTSRRACAGGSSPAAPPWSASARARRTRSTPR